ncbi:MAG TPA: phosphoribosyltransferase family protein [Gemmatimonadales bacterium]|nr:phosphoribosyltransferase family protein [Gemmatimonadales bacterium]
MKRSIPSSQRGLLEIDWPLFGELCRALALRVAQSYEPDLVVGVAKAGVIPGAVIASIMQKDFTAIGVTRSAAGAMPELVSAPFSAVAGRRVLLVDETCDTGNTLRVALEELKLMQPAEIRTAVSIRTGPYQPDFHALASDKLIVLPWDREVLVNGEIVVRPDLVEYLAGEG